MSIVVLSTGRNSPTKHICLASVQMQLGGPYEHIYVESAPDVTVLENVHREVHKLPPDTIVVWLDGDDWLFACHSLLTVHRIYLQNPECLLTYGQFVDDKGRPGFAAPYTTTDYRSAPWLATHLKTFRAGLFQRIDISDLKHETVHHDAHSGSTSYRLNWIPMASDQAVMLPMLEMAGPHRIYFNREPLVIYNTANSHWANADDAGRKEEADWAQRIRAKRRYERLP